MMVSWIGDWLVVGESCCAHRRRSSVNPLTQALQSRIFISAGVNLGHCGAHRPRENTLFRGLSAATLEAHRAAVHAPRLCAGRGDLFAGGSRRRAVRHRDGAGCASARVRPGPRGVPEHHGAGDTFGEIALLDGRPRTASASATAASDLFVITREQFLGVLAHEPQLVDHLLQLLCARLRWVSGFAEESTLLPVPARLARRLLSLGKLHGRESAGGIELKVSQDEMARFLGFVATNRQSVFADLEGAALGGVGARGAFSSWMRGGLEGVVAGEQGVRDLAGTSAIEVPQRSRVTRRLRWVGRSGAVAGDEVAWRLRWVGRSGGWLGDEVAWRLRWVGRSGWWLGDGGADIRFAKTKGGSFRKSNIRPSSLCLGLLAIGGWGD